MAPSAMTHDAKQDVDLTSSAIENGLPSKTNGLAKPASPIGTFRAADTTYTRTAAPRPVPTEEEALASHETICTDHMVMVSWSAARGWAAPELKPYGPLSLMPTASVLHYATECFEGLKAYRGYDGGLRLFRPDCNARRMQMSAGRVSLPTFDPAELEQLIVKLMEVDGPKWLPRERAGSFLYLRPTLIGTNPALGVQPAKEALLYVIANFMPRMWSIPGGMKLHTSPEDMVRAWVGGFGFAKLGANYGPSLLASREARERGYDQILWLYGAEGYCTEVGASNFAVVWENARGQREIVTAPLDDRLILDGVTRRSALELARERLGGRVEVVERKYTIGEVMQADAEGRLLEAFAMGTAFFVCPISKIHHRGEDINISMGDKGEGGEVTLQLRDWIGGIMYGKEEHKWGVVVNEE